MPALSKPRRRAGRGRSMQPHCHDTTDRWSWLVPAISAQRMQARYDSILAAAKSVFTEHGFAGASISDIARRAGVSDGLVYRYFTNKRDLLYHVLRVFYERIMTDLEADVLRQTRFEDRLHLLIGRHLDAFVADAALCRLFISEVRVASDYQGSAFQELNRRYTAILIRIVDEALAAGAIRRDVNPRLLRDVIFGAIEHRAWSFVNGRGDLAKDR